MLTVPLLREMLVKTELAVMHALNVLRRGGASTEEESALVRDLPDNLKKWKWLKQQLVYAAPVHGTGDNGGIESEGAVPAKPARIKTAANKGGGGDVKGSPPSPNGSSDGSASTPTSRGDDLDAHKWDDVDVELEEKPGGVPEGMGAEEAEIYERVKARVRDNLDDAKKFVAANITSSDPYKQKFAEAAQKTFDHWFTNANGSKARYLIDPEDGLKELQAKYPDKWFEVLRARSLDNYGVGHEKGVLFDLDEDIKRRLDDLREGKERPKINVDTEPIHPGVQQMQEAAEDAKRVAILYKGADRQALEEHLIFPDAPGGLYHIPTNMDVANAAAEKLKTLVRSLPDTKPINEEGADIDAYAEKLLHEIAYQNVQAVKERQSSVEERATNANKIMDTARKEWEKKKEKDEKDRRDRAYKEKEARERREKEETPTPVQPDPGVGTQGKTKPVEKDKPLHKIDTNSALWKRLTVEEQKLISQKTNPGDDDKIRELLAALNSPHSRPNRSTAVGVMARGDAPVAMEPQTELRKQEVRPAEPTPPPIEKPEIVWTQPWLIQDRKTGTKKAGIDRLFPKLLDQRSIAPGDSQPSPKTGVDRQEHPGFFFLNTEQIGEAPKEQKKTDREKFRESIKDMTYEQREEMLKAIIVKALAKSIEANEDMREKAGQARTSPRDQPLRDLLEKVRGFVINKSQALPTAPQITDTDTTVAPVGVGQTGFQVPKDTIDEGDTINQAHNKVKELQKMLEESEKERKEGEERLGRAQQSLDKKGEELTKVQERIAALEADHSAQAEATRKEITELQSKEIDLKATIERLEKRHADITKELQKVTAAKEAAERSLREANDRIRELSSELSGARDSLAEEQRRSAETARRLQEDLAAKDGAIRAQEEVVQRGLDRVRQLEKSADLRGAEEARLRAELDENKGQLGKATTAANESHQKFLDADKELKKAIEDGKKNEEQFERQVQEIKEKEGQSAADKDKKLKEITEAHEQLKAELDSKKEELTSARRKLAVSYARAGAAKIVAEAEADRLKKELDKARAAAELDKARAAEELKSARSELAAAEESVRTLTAEQRRLAGQLQDALAGKQRAEEEAAAEKTRSAATEKRLQSELDVKEEELRAQEAVLQRELKRVKELEKTSALHDAKEAELQEALREKNAQLDEAKKAKEATDLILAEAETELEELKEQIDEAKVVDNTVVMEHKRLLAQKEREVAAKREESELLKKQAEAAQDAAEELAAELDRVTSAYEAELEKAKDRVTGAEKSVAALKAAQTELNGQLKAAQAGQKRAEEEIAAEKTRSAATEKRLQSELDVKEEELRAQEAALQKELERVKELEKTSALHDAKEVELQEALREKNAQLDKATEEKQASELKLREAEEELQKAFAKGVEQAEQFETEAKAIKSKMEEIKQASAKELEEMKEASAKELEETKEASAKELEETKEASAKELDELMDQLFAVENAARQARDTNKRLLAEKERDVDDVKKQLDIVKQQANDAQDAAEELAAELERVHDAYEAELEKNAKELEGAKGNLRAAEQAVAALKNEQKALNDELKSAQAGQKRAEEESAGLTSQLRTKETELDSAHKARDAKEKELANAQANLKEQRRLNTEAEAKLKEQETELAQQKEESTKTAEELKAQNTKAEELKGQIKAGKEREQTLEGEVRRKEEEAKRTEEKLKTAQTKLDTARGELANVQAGLRKKEAEVAAKDTQLAASKAEVSSLNTKIAEAAVKEKENEEAVKDKQKEVDDANKEKERLVREADDLRNKAKGAADKADGLQRDIQAKEIENKGLQNKAAQTVIAGHDAAIARKDDEINQLNALLVLAQHTLATERAQAASVIADLAAKNAEIANAVIIVTQLKVELDKAQGEVKRLDGEATARAAEVDILIQNNRSLGEQLNAAQTQLTESQARVAQLEQEGVMAAGEITRLKGVESAQNTRISILQDQVSSGAQALRDKEGQLQKQIGDNQQLQLDIDAANKTVGEKENEIADLTTTLRAWMEGYAKLQAKEAATQDLLDQATQEKDRLDREVKSKEASLVQAQQDKNVLEGRVSTLVQEHAAKEKELRDAHERSVVAARVELDNKVRELAGKDAEIANIRQVHSAREKATKAAYDAEYNRMKASLEQSVLDLGAQLALKDGEITNSKQALDSANGNLFVARAEVHGLRELIRNLKSERDTAQDALGEATVKGAQKDAEIRRLTEERQLLGSRVGQLSSEKDKLNEEKLALEGELTVNKDELKRTREREEWLKRDLLTIDDRYKRQIDELNGEILLITGQRDNYYGDGVRVQRERDAIQAEFDKLRRILISMRNLSHQIGDENVRNWINDITRTVT
eukprot:jgi/Mesvir1/21504/Mv03951-RA.1